LKSINENVKLLVRSHLYPLPLKYMLILAKDEEHGTLKLQIEELKVALEHAQMLRRRKIEYDAVAEKVNTLPSREELET
jgi:hypothetical protein